MSITAVFSIRVSAFGEEEFLPGTFAQGNNSQSPLQSLPAYAFATGFQSLLAPTGAAYLLIDNISGTLTLKGSSGDTGIPVTGGTILLPTTGGTVGINATAGALGDLLWF